MTFPNDPFCARRTRDADSGLLVSVDNTPFNVARSELSGVGPQWPLQHRFDAFGGMQFAMRHGLDLV